MRLLYSLFLIAAVAEGARTTQKDGKIALPGDAGAAFLESFTTMSDMYSESKPESREDLIRDSGKILASFCDEGDSDCAKKSYEGLQEDMKDTEVGGELTYPDDFDPEVMQSLEKVQTTVQTVDMENVDSVLKDLAAVQEKIVGMKDVKDQDKTAALVGVEIATESVRAWHKVYADPEHPLYGVHYSSQYFNKEEDKTARKLKDVDVASIALNDFQSGFERAMKDLSQHGSVSASTIARSFMVCNTGGGQGGHYSYYGGYWSNSAHGYHGYGHGKWTTHTHKTDGTIVTNRQSHIHNSDGTMTTSQTAAHAHATHDHEYTHSHISSP